MAVVALSKGENCYGPKLNIKTVIGLEYSNARKAIFDVVMVVTVTLHFCFPF
jgi:hypothetical protein